MRTTLDIEDDVLFAAREIARREKKSLGQVISELARRAFTGPAAGKPLFDEHIDSERVPAVHGATASHLVML